MRRGLNQYPPMTYAPGERLGLGIQLGTEPGATRLGMSIGAGAVQAADGGRVAVLEHVQLDQ